MALAGSRAEVGGFMSKVQRSLTAILGIVSLVAMVGLANAQGKGKEKEKQKVEKEKVEKEKVEKGKGEKQKGKGEAKAKPQHISGKQLLGDKIKTNGKHVLDQRGKYTATATVRGGKIAGINVKHSEKGDVPVTKYKTRKKMASKPGEAGGFSLASNRHGVLAQLQDLGTTYIGYAYIDEYGEEYIYWFPVEMIYDGDTGAIEYVVLD